MKPEKSPNLLNTLSNPNNLDDSLQPLDLDSSNIGSIKNAGRLTQKNTTRKKTNNPKNNKKVIYGDEVRAMSFFTCGCQLCRA